MADITGRRKAGSMAIDALLGTILLTICLISGTINSVVFHQWVIKDLSPKLPANSMIVMDNVTFHKRQDTQQAIREAGHTLEYLRVYSPDLNPIEKKWTQAKAIIR